MSTNKIRDYIHCKICGSGELAVSWTEKGLQVWCEHCDKNVLELDFLGRDVRQVDNTDPRVDEARQKPQSVKFLPSHSQIETVK